MTQPDIEAWLYEGARHHVSGWAKGRLEARSAVAYSSQTLCVSVFGALDGHPRAAEILSAIGEAAGVELPKTEPSIVCEDRSHEDVLNERGGRSIPTSPDVLVRWQECVLTIESKFREGLGPCGQTKAGKTKDGKKLPPPCTGDHAPGSDRKTGTDAACRLTIWDGRREPRLYWQVAERLFQPDVLAVPRRPCPFANGRYQLMRNIAFASEFARLNGLPRFGVIVAHVAGSPSAAHTDELVAEFTAMLLPEVRNRFGAVSYEKIAEIAAAHGDVHLAAWIGDRIRAGLAANYLTAQSS
jgi:hypothetical protein